jgi:predicted ATPase/class 3 adenylate cyclase
VIGLPSGTVTFLFTDIESSTRLWQEQSEQMALALARHDEIVRSSIERHDGVVVKLRGDGAHAAFATASDAIAAAVAAQIALADEEWSLAEPLRVRMGLHSGPAELRDGDYYGTAVNRAARITSVAHGGQVVISAATWQLARDAPVQVVDLGEHRLKDLSEPEQIFQVMHADLDREFPPLRSLDHFATNLPTQVTSFVGRESDVDRVAALLRETRLVTVAGTGGVGKTRVAVHVAAEVLPGFRDGAWFCELASGDDAQTMSQAVASTLGCVQHPGLSLSESVVEYLKVRELLLVLDNCEHLLDEAGDLVESVLRACPDVTVLVTSREALDVTGERVVRLRSLATPGESSDDAALLDSPAVQLFRDRAIDAAVDVEWDAQQWSAVGEICRRVDGIPLAIELAAARTVSMSPVDVAGHLDERFRLLTGKRRGRIERHQTLRATVEWSYQLLDADEREVFDRLGVFTGSFDEAAAVAVAGGDELDSWTVNDALASLVAKSMLGTDTGPAGTTRYTMHETLRQYAREQLDDTECTDQYRRALAHHLVAFAQAAGEGVRGPDDLLWLARVRADIDNVRAAIGWALDADDAADQQLGLSILGSLAWIGDMHLNLGLAVLAVKSLPLTEPAGPEVRAPVLQLAGTFYWNDGDFEAARRFIERALQDRVASTALNPLDAMGMLISLEMSNGNHARAFELIDEAKRSYADSDEFEDARMYGTAATFEAMAGQVDTAREDAHRALVIARRIGNQHLLVGALDGLAWALQRDDPEAALAAAEQGLQIQRASGAYRAVFSGLQSLAAHLRARLGDEREALRLLHIALVVARDDGLWPQAAAVLNLSLTPLRHTGRSEAVATIVGILQGGALAHISFPGMADSTSRALDRIRETLGDDRTEQLVALGASMSYDEALAYTLDQLGSTAPDDAGRSSSAPIA